MLTIKKINTLKPRVRVRKLGAIFHEAYLGVSFDESYLKECMELLLSQKKTEKIYFSFLKKEERVGKIYITVPSIFLERLLQIGIE